MIVGSGNEGEALVSRERRHRVEVAALVAAVALAGCTVEEVVIGRATGLAITAFAAPTDSCASPAAADAVPLEEGVLDLLFADRYEAIALVANTVVDPERGGPDGVLLEGFDVRVTAPGGPTGAWDFATELPVTAYIDESAVVAIPVALLPATALRAIVLDRFPEAGEISSVPIGDIASFEAQTEVAVRALGVTVTGRRIETAEASLDVRLCGSCLLECPADSASEHGLVCESLDPPSSSPCVLGQDQPIDCRLCAPRYDAATCRALCAP